MLSMHRGPSLPGLLQLSSSSQQYVCSRCAARSFHFQRRLYAEENGSQDPDKPSARPASRRQGSRIAGRMIQGLRSIAPGGFGATSNTTPTTGDQRVPSHRVLPPSRPPPSPVVRIRRQESDGQHGEAQMRRGRDRRRDGGEEAQHATTSRAALSRPADIITSGNPEEDRIAARRLRELPLLQRFFAGRPVRFADAVEKARVEKKLAKYRAEYAATRGKTVDQLKPAFRWNNLDIASVPQEVQNEVIERTFGGKHEQLKDSSKAKTAQQKTMVHLQQSILMNGSYNDKARRAMLDFMGRTWPEQRQARAAA